MFLMQTVMIDFPGHTARFDKTLLKKLVNDIQNNLLNSEIEWYKCKPPLTILTEIPSEYQPSNIDDANMVIVKQNRFKILVSFSYKSGGGKIFIYEDNLSKEDMEVVSNVLKNNGFFTPKTQKSLIKTVLKGFLIVFAGALYSRLVIYDMDFLLPLPLSHAIIVMAPAIILGIIGTIYLIKGWKIYSTEKKGLK